MMRPQIFTAKSAGVCFGVERALNLGEKAITAPGSVSSLGPLIHNPQTVQAMSDRGLKVVDKIEDAQARIVFRSHGVTKEVEQKAKSLGLEIIDATCPLVKVPQKFAQKLSEQGYYVVIVGDKNHPEVQGVRSYITNSNGQVIGGVEEVENLPPAEKVGVICQTTLKRSLLDAVVEKLKTKYTEVKVQNTICSATRERQDAALELATEMDVVVVIGGRNSSNTHKLFDICNTHSKAYLIETQGELRPEWFADAQKIGVTAGASTPLTLLGSVRDTIAQITSGQIMADSLADQPMETLEGGVEVTL